MVALIKIAVYLLADVFRLVCLLFRSTNSLQAENLFLRRQLALFVERGVQPRRVDAATRASLAILARMFDWRRALVVVQPATLIGWHRAGWAFLAPQVSTRPAANPGGAASLDSADGY
jgi:putative transposase